MGQVVLQYFESLDYEGTVVFPDLQVDPVSRKDLRDQDDTSLRLIIWLSVLKDFSVEHKGAKEGDPRIPKSRETAERLMKKAGLSGRTLRAELFRFGRRYDKPPFQRATTRLHPSGEPGEAMLCSKLRQETIRRCCFCIPGTQSLGIGMAEGPSGIG